MDGTRQKCMQRSRKHQLPSDFLSFGSGPLEPWMPARLVLSSRVFSSFCTYLLENLYFTYFIFSSPKLSQNLLLNPPIPKSSQGTFFSSPIYPLPFPQLSSPFITIIITLHSPEVKVYPNTHPMPASTTWSDRPQNSPSQEEIS